ncbi:S1 family peptidase [Bacillus cereus]|uniref:S1 family peptidase n=1 Tax=Bacillus cereus TaxID=1396 RepID=UPI0020D26E97|nr:S1 family peptidase [Bacillus cereus]
MKVGHHTHGVITAVNATVDVNYGSGRVARFRDQIITTNLSSGGDSGSLIMTNDGVAIGLLFAGSSSVTIANHIEHIRSLLGIEVAETIL